VAQIADCSQINTKHINTVWAEQDEAQTALFKDQTLRYLPGQLKARTSCIR